ncbi:hypothetical protein ACFL6C_08055 [Myxococcota bacterium]
MFQELYEEMVRFASDGDFSGELKSAREEYVERTGDLFETDANYEPRIAAFLEWYVLDRAVSTNANKTPARLYIESVTPNLTTPEVNRLRGMTRTILSLFEFRRVNGDFINVVNLLNNEKHRIFERRKPAGLDSGDILEARLIPFDDKLYFSESFTCHPRPARKAILKAAKAFRKGGHVKDRITLVHRVAYLSNRCERYKHVDPKKIFEDLNAS